MTDVKVDPPYAWAVAGTKGVGSGWPAEARLQGGCCCLALPDMRVKLPVSSEKFPVPMRREFDRNPLSYVCEN